MFTMQKEKGLGKKYFILKYFFTCQNVYGEMLLFSVFFSLVKNVDFKKKKS